MQVEAGVEPWIDCDSLESDWVNMVEGSIHNKRLAECRAANKGGRGAHVRH
jgi:hypothetical protein